MLSFITMVWLEFRLRLKSLVGWSLIWLVLGSILLALYDTFSAEQEDFSAVLKSIPEGLSQSFNIRENYLSSVEVFLSGQFLTFYTLIGSIFACFIGISLLASKIEDRTIFQLITKNRSRIGVYLISLLEGVIFYAISSIFVGLSLFILSNLLTKQDIISESYFIGLFVGTTVLNLFFFILSLVIGIFLGRSKGLSIGTSFAGFSWFINTLSKINGFPSWIQYISPFYYFNINELTEQFTLDYQRLSALLILILFVGSIGLWRFRRMDIAL